MQVAIVSDTHVPDRESEIPERFRERIREADRVIHAGDFTSPEVLEEVEGLAADLTAVCGNMDPEEIGLPSVDSVTVEEVTFVVTHGAVRTLEEWFDAVAGAARERADEPRIGVGGHSHSVEDETHEGVRVLNPGSVTGADPAERATMLTADVDDGEVDVTVHEA